METGDQPSATQYLPKPHSLAERLGFWTGALISPVFGIGSALRRDRVFHPKGVFFEASVVPATNPGRYAELARRLAGSALVRLSAGGWRKNRPLVPDVLGFTVRFKGESLEPEGVQDLLLITARSPWTLVPDSLLTDRSNFLNNIYYGLSPFEVDGERDKQLRVIPRDAKGEGEDRYQRIINAVENGNARFDLQISNVANADSAADWETVASIVLRQQVESDEQEVLFYPFRDGQSINPQGFIHYLRAVPYLTSRYARRRFGDKD